MKTINHTITKDWIKNVPIVDWLLNHYNNSKNHESEIRLYPRNKANNPDGWIKEDIEKAFNLLKSVQDVNIELGWQALTETMGFQPQHINVLMAGLLLDYKDDNLLNLINKYAKENPNDGIVITRKEAYGIYDGRIVELDPNYPYKIVFNFDFIFTFEIEYTATSKNKYISLTKLNHSILIAGYAAKTEYKDLTHGQLLVDVFTDIYNNFIKLNR